MIGSRWTVLPSLAKMQVLGVRVQRVESKQQEIAEAKA